MESDAKTETGGEHASSSDRDTKGASGFLVGSAAFKAVAGLFCSLWWVRFPSAPVPLLLWFLAKYPCKQGVNREEGLAL